MPTGLSRLGRPALVAVIAFSASYLLTLAFASWRSAAMAVVLDAPPLC